MLLMQVMKEVIEEEEIRRSKFNDTTKLPSTVLAVSSSTLCEQGFAKFFDEIWVLHAEHQEDFYERAKKAHTYMPEQDLKNKFNLLKNDEPARYKYSTFAIDTASQSF